MILCKTCVLGVDHTGIVSWNIMMPSGLRISERKGNLYGCCGIGLWLYETWQGFMWRKKWNMNLFT